MRSSWSRVGLLSNVTGVLVKKGNLDTDIDTHPGRLPSEDEGRDRVMILQAKENERLPASQQKLGERYGKCLISDFQSPEFLLFK